MRISDNLKKLYQQIPDKVKLKYIAPFVSLIHSVDSIKLLSTINKEAIKNKRLIDCLLQLKLVKEETKF